MRSVHQLAGSENPSREASSAARTAIARRPGERPGHALDSARLEGHRARGPGTPGQGTKGKALALVLPQPIAYRLLTCTAAWSKLGLCGKSRRRRSLISGLPAR